MGQRGPLTEEAKRLRRDRMESNRIKKEINKYLDMLVLDPSLPAFNREEYYAELWDMAIDEKDRFLEAEALGGIATFKFAVAILPFVTPYVKRLEKAKKKAKTAAKRNERLGQRRDVAAEDEREMMQEDDEAAVADDDGQLEDNVGAEGEDVEDEIDAGGAENKQQHGRNEEELEDIEENGEIAGAPDVAEENELFQLRVMRGLIQHVVDSEEFKIENLPPTIFHTIQLAGIVAPPEQATLPALVAPVINLAGDEIGGERVRDDDVEQLAGEVNDGGFVEDANVRNLVDDASGGRLVGHSPVGELAEHGTVGDAAVEQLAEDANVGGFVGNVNVSGLVENFNVLGFVEDASGGRLVGHSPVGELAEHGTVGGAAVEQLAGEMNGGGFVGHATSIDTRQGINTGNAHETAKRQPGNRDGSSAPPAKRSRVDHSANGRQSWALFNIFCATPTAPSTTDVLKILQFMNIGKLSLDDVHVDQSIPLLSNHDPPRYAIQFDVSIESEINQNLKKLVLHPAPSVQNSQSRAFAQVWIDLVPNGFFLARASFFVLVAELLTRQGRNVGISSRGLHIDNGTVQNLEEICKSGCENLKEQVISKLNADGRKMLARETRTYTTKSFWKPALI